MFRLENRINHDLLGFKVAQVDHGETRIGLVVDEQELTVVFALGFRHGWVVCIAPVDFLAIDIALTQHSLGVLVKAIALPGFRREYADVLQNAHGRNTVHNDLTSLTTGGEGNEIVAFAGWHVGLGRSQQILLAEVTTLHDILK